MRTAMLFNRMRLCLLPLLVAAATAMTTTGCEEPTDPSLEPPDVVDTATSTTAPAPTLAAPTTSTAGDLPAAPRSPADYRRAAENGDTSAMVLLGRSHQSIGQVPEARRWYQRAADAGSEEGKQALAELDAPATRPVADAVALATGPATAPAPSSDEPVTSETLRNPASTRRVAVAPPPPPADPSKLRWIDLGAVLNYEDMVGDTHQVPVDPRQPNGKTQFLGRMTSRDGTIVVAAIGPSENDLSEVTAVIAVRNKFEPGASQRVRQAAAVTARVTADNVNQQEFVEWVHQYLQTEQRSAPIFRNGWRIIVSGSAAEGRRDPKPHLGTLVMIEMKK